MQKILLGMASLAMFSTAALADDWVNGYTRRDGTAVQGYYRTSPDSNPYNNYSTRGNTNPYTGQPGYKNPDYSSSGNGLWGGGSTERRNTTRGW